MSDDVRATEMSWSMTLALNAFEGMIMVLIFVFGAVGMGWLVMGSGGKRRRGNSDSAAEARMVENRDRDDEKGEKEPLPKYSG